MVENKSKVLVVDDIQSNIEFVTDVLELENLHVLNAKNGEEALEITREEEPDLILLDISMPGMDGYEVCKILKSDTSTCEIPIIFLTARVQKEEIIKGFELGAVDYIVKPFNFSELISRVKTHLDLKNKGEQLKELNQKLESIIDERTCELKVAYEELKHVNEHLLLANEKLEKLDRAKTDFVLHINHELRTPLNGIQGYVDLLSETLREEPGKSYVKSIQTLTSRLIKVAELSLLFAELNTREQQIDLHNVDIVGVLNNAIDNAELSKKNLQIDFENPYSQIMVKAESRLLQNCFSEVIDNAIKYSPSGSTIEMSLKVNESVVEFILADKGPGLSDKALKELFNVFSADNLSYHSYGFGIGLATVKTILDLFGGGISVSNREPNGAVVRITMPAIA
ncbi:MAG: hybrid sensor histidine kinase/response regulator [Bacteroidales bacterium]|nr:hybrid sensor histidine kinase/response regulator [Bacteroidales bacterium]